MNTEQTPIEKAIAALEKAKRYASGCTCSDPYKIRKMSDPSCAACYFHEVLEGVDEALDALRAMPTSESAEPVAWSVRTDIGGDIVVTHAATRTAVVQIAVERYRGAPGAIHGVPVPLYTHPPNPEQPGKVLTDDVIGRYSDSFSGTASHAVLHTLRHVRDNGYLAPAAGLTVEEGEQLVKEWCFGWCERVAPDDSDWDDLRARLTAAMNAKTEKP